MAGTETKRIIELTEASTIQSGDFIAVDSSARGTKKVPASALATSAALTAETNARTEAITAEQTAREQADEQMSERMDGIEEQTALIQNPTKTLSGALVSFTDGADMPMVACTAEIVPKQSGSGTPSPDNVRPISGWESVNVTDAGKNLIDVDSADNQGAYIDSDGVIHSSNAWTTSGLIRVEPNKPYVLSGLVTHPNTGKDNYRLFDSKQNYIGVQSFNIQNYPITFASGVSFVQFCWKDTDKANVQFEQNSTATTYHAYNGNTYTTDLGRTVYGGTLDVVSGVLTVDRAIVDLGTLNWSYQSAQHRFYTVVSGAKFPTSASVVGNAICSNYSIVQFSTLSTGSDNNVFATLDKGNTYVTIRDTRYTDAASFKTAMNGVQLVYELATPQTYTLTGQEVSTLLGNNNVWADSGDVEITYRRDISIVLENLENALSGSNSLNSMMMSAPTETTSEEPTEDEAEDDMR